VGGERGDSQAFFSVQLIAPSPTICWVGVASVKKRGEGLQRSTVLLVVARVYGSKLGVYVMDDRE
jgi:hypothetical protein